MAGRLWRKRRIPSVQATKKLQALKQYCGREVKKLLRSLPDPNREDNETDYELHKLNSHYVP